jgi:hypothetical protein
LLSLRVRKLEMVLRGREIGCAGRWIVLEWSLSVEVLIFAANGMM